MKLKNRPGRAVTFVRSPLKVKCLLEARGASGRLGFEGCGRDMSVRCGDPFVPPSVIRRIECSTSSLTAKYYGIIGNFYKISISDLKNATYVGAIRTKCFAVMLLIMHKIFFITI